MARFRRSGTFHEVLFRKPNDIFGTHRLAGSVERLALTSAPMTRNLD